MKRNFPPDLNSEEAHQDRIELQNRIEQLFSQTRDLSITSPSISIPNPGQEGGDSREIRNVSFNSVGILKLDKQHIVLKSLKGLDRNLICYCEEAAYHYMEPFEALYSLEMNKLLVFHNDQPLSLVEAYYLLLSQIGDKIIDKSQSFREYLVFRHLNRIGYICIYTNTCNEPRNYHVYKRENLDKSDRRKLLSKNADFKLIVKDANSNDRVCDNDDDDSNKLEGEKQMRTILALVDIDSNMSFVEFNQLNENDLNLKSRSSKN